MSDVEKLKTDVKRLSVRATAAKMELHDFSEELPTNWEKIPEVAARVHAVFAELAARRAELRQTEVA